MKKVSFKTNRSFEEKNFGFLITLKGKIQFENFKCSVNTKRERSPQQKRSVSSCQKILAMKPGRPSEPPKATGGMKERRWLPASTKAEMKSNAIADDSIPERVNKSIFLYSSELCTGQGTGSIQ